MSTSEMSWLKCARVKEDLELVETALADSLRCGDPFVLEVCTYLIESGGKRLRPTLVLLAGQFGNQYDPCLLSTAVAIELMHLATLYHDDIIDEAITRRGFPSANAVWGDLISTFAGDYLFARSTELFAAAGHAVNRMASEAITRMWKGQMQETESAYNLDLNEDSYLHTIDMKTATLFELSCRIGALVSDVCPVQGSMLIEYGRSLGVAFQLTDDVMDIVADEIPLKKSPGTDLKEGIYTLPVIYTLGLEDSGADRLWAILTQTELGQEEIDEALTILRRNRSLPHTLDIAMDFIQRAKGQIAQLPAGSAKESLYHLIDFIIDRPGLKGVSGREG